MDKIRVGFVGVGGMGQCAHLKHFVLVPDCEVVALAEIRPKLAQAVAARYAVPKVYKDHREMLAAEKLDAIVASQPFTRHGVLVPELAEAGIPIFTEKPLAGSIECGRKIIAALKKTGAWQMVGYHKRSDPATMYAKARIDALKASGELGKMKYVRIIMPAGDWIASGFLDLIKTDEPYPQLEWDPPASDMDEATFRAYTDFTNYYIHQINLMRHLLGEPYKVTYADPSGVMLATQSESGIAGVIEMTPYQTTVDWQESAFVAFERGYVKVDLPAPVAVNRPGRIEMLRDPGGGATPETTVPMLPWISAMHQQAINFVKAVKGEMPPLCTPEEALKDMLVSLEYTRLFKGASLPKA